MIYYVVFKDSRPVVKVSEDEAEAIALAKKRREQIKIGRDYVDTVMIREILSAATYESRNGSNYAETKELPELPREVVAYNLVLIEAIKLSYGGRTGSGTRKRLTELYPKLKPEHRKLLKGADGNAHTKPEEVWLS